MAICIFLYGPPGSGKSNLGKILEKEFGFSLINIGSILRDKSKYDSAIDREIQMLINEGKAIPLRIFTDIFKNTPRINTNKLVIDGFPRTLEQLKYINRFLDTLSDVKFSICGVKLNLNLFEVKARIHNRQICSNCGYSNNIDNVVCDSCISANFVVRHDDNSETIVAKRIKIYFDQTLGIINQFQLIYNTIELNANENLHKLVKEVIVFAENNE